MVARKITGIATQARVDFKSRGPRPAVFAFSTHRLTASAGALLALFAMVSAVLLLLSPPVAAQIEDGNVVSAEVVCSDGDGLVTVSIVNTSQSLRRYRVLVADLPERGINVGGGVSGTLRVGGLPDGAVNVVVQRNGANVWADTVMVDCDPALSASVTVSCLDGRGRFDFILNNQSATAVKFVVEIAGLPPRSRAVSSDSSRTLTVTGREDGDYRLVVTADGLLIFDKSATVGCDPAGPAEPAPVRREVGVTVSCLDGRGRIDVSLRNPSQASRTYTVGVGPVAPRTRTLAPGQAAVVNVTGRPNGPITVKVDGVSTASGRFVQTVNVDCDRPSEAAPAPDAADSGPVVEADGVGARVRCVGGNGAIDIAVRNDTSDARPATVSVPGLPGRSKIVAAGGTSLFTFTGRADDLYDVVVTTPSGETVSRSLVVFCDGADLTSLTLEWINDYRARHGVGQVISNDELTEAAEYWSTQMMDNGVLEHDLCCLGERLPAYLPNWAELVGRGETRLVDLQLAFENSPSHATALRDPNYEEVGVGFAFDGIALWVTIYLGGR